MNEYLVRLYDVELIWGSELEWVFRLMPDLVLLQLKDIVKFASANKEYERCCISAGGMNAIVSMIEDEMRIRKMEMSGMRYKEAIELIISERRVAESETDLTEVEEGRESEVRDDSGDGRKEEGGTETIWI